MPVAATESTLVAQIESHICPSRVLYLATRPDAEAIALEAFISSSSMASISVSDSRISSARQRFALRKSGPSVRILSKIGLNKSRSRGSHCRVVRKIHIPSLEVQRSSLSIFINLPELLFLSRYNDTHLYLTYFAVSHSFFDFVIFNPRFI